MFAKSKTIRKILFGKARTYQHMYMRQNTYNRDELNIKQNQNFESSTFLFEFWKTKMVFNVSRA